MSNWKKLRNRLLETNRDLDAEFDQFLNESLSEDSVSSPRNKNPDLKRKDFGKAQAKVSKPSWLEGSTEDESSKDTVVQSWFKATAPVKEEEEEEEEEGEIHEDDPLDKNNLPEESVPSVDSQAEVTQDIGVSVTMSKDSLDDGTGRNAESEKNKPSDAGERLHSVDKLIEEEEDYSYTEPTGTPTSTASSPGQEPHGGISEDENTVTGMNTQKEQEDKRKFFEKLEEENRSDLDYHELNEMLDGETSAMTEHDRPSTADLLQATGADLGNSVFNTTGFGGAEVTPHNKEPPEKSSSKPTMLSKVSLMDSLESSMGTAHRQKLKEIRQKHADLSTGKEKDPIDEDDEYSISMETGAEDTRPDVIETEGLGTGTDFLNTSGANELADLHEALKVAQMVSTNDSGGNVGLQDAKAGIKTLHGVVPNRTVETDQAGTSFATKVSPSDNVHEINQLRPVIASSEETKDIWYTTSVSNPQLNQVLPSDMIAAAREQHGVVLPRHTEHLKPVLGHQDIFQATPGFSAHSPSDFLLPESQPEGLVRGTPHDDIASEENLGAPKGLRMVDRNADEKHGFELDAVASFTASSEEDTPPPESLKEIKNVVKRRRELVDQSRGGHARDARNSSPSQTRGGHARIVPRNSSPKARPKGSRPARSVARGKENEEVGTRRGKSKTKQDDDRSRFGWRNTPDVTPTRGTRGVTGKERKKRDKSPKKQPKDAQQSSPSKLAASAESFAKYLNTFVQHERQEGGLEWSADPDDDDGRSLGNDSFGSNRLSRERALQKEVEHWRGMWQDERKQCEKLVDELAEKDKEWKRREQHLKLEYSTQMNDLKQNVFVLESKLKDINVDNKKKVAKGGNLKGMSDEELQKLEREIREQDQLLTGYQQENERLYGDVKDVQTKAKTAETQMFKENQKLATEVASLKEKLERKEGVFEAAGTAAFGAERIHQLHSQVKLMKTNEQEMRKEMDNLENERRDLDKKIKNLEREKDVAVQKTNEVLGMNSQFREDLESSHAANVERLNRKLKWYVENQELLDKDAASLKKNDEEIRELRELVARLEAERGTTTVENDKKEKDRAMDAKRIQDLERQVREMEQIIKRRYPNSIPALIYAASAAPGDGKSLKPEDSPKKATTPSYAFLDNRAKKLERELEEREEEWGRSFRVLEQKYNGMQLEYEGQVTDLRRELTDARDNVASYTHTRAHASVLEKELAAARDKHERKTHELQAEVKVLREALRASKSDETEAKVSKTKRGKKDSRGSQKPKGIEEDLEVRLRSLYEECEKKNHVVEELRCTCAQLQRQREEMLADKTSLVTHKNLQGILDVVNSENHQLRDQMSLMTIEVDQQRVRYQGSLAEVERMTRQEREASHDELCSLRTQHKKELDSVKEEYSIQHSRSRMAEMSNKIAGLEIVIERLKDKLAMGAETEAELASNKLHEELLKQEINQLKNDLKKAKQFHTPQMHHYYQLDDKIAAMETRHRQREQELQAIIHKTKLTADVEKDEVLDKWRKLLRKKTEETERFRVELNGILSVLEELRQQGVVINIPTTRKVTQLL